MSFYHRYISPSKSVKNPESRIRCEILAGSLLAKELLITATIVSHLWSGGEFPLDLLGIAAFNLICYLGSRTRFFEWAAYAMILDPICFTTGVALFQIANLNTAPQIALVLAMGPIVAGIVLSRRATIGFSFLTMLTFLVIVLKADAALKLFFEEEALIIGVISLLSVITVTLREKAETALAIERAKVLQSSKLAALGEMACGIAHEVNSPLTAISMNVELLEEEMADNEIDLELIKDQLNDITQCTQRISKIISGLKKLNRDSAGAPTQLIQLSEWIANSIGTCRQQFVCAGIDLRTPQLFATCYHKAHPVEMTQVLLNLLNNSFDAVVENDLKWVEIKIEEDENQIRVLVVDSGAGVDQDFKAKLFQPFSTTKDYGRGTGLGLSTARGIVKNHGGELVYVENAVNTTFVIQLPKPSLSA